MSIDLPSGMITDLGVGMINRNIVHASLTLTLVGPTLAFFMPENAELIGRWKTLDVPMDEEAMNSTRCTSRIIDAKAVRTVLPRAATDSIEIRPRRRAHLRRQLRHARRRSPRHSRGHPLGLRTRDVPRATRCAFYVMQSSVPSAMFETDGGDVDIKVFDNPRQCTGVAIGPGIGRSDDTLDGLEVFLKACFAADKPLILDADALNCMSMKPSMIDFIPARSVLTRTPANSTASSAHRVRTPRAYSKRSKWPPATR